MMCEVTEIIASANKPAPLHGPLVIYGAGNTGRSVCSYVRGVGYGVVGFIDAGAADGQTVFGLPVWRPGKWPAEFPVNEHSVLVAIHNRDVPMAPLLADMARWGFRRVVNMVDYINLFPDHQPPRYWLAPSALYAQHAADIDRLFAILGDDLSRSNAERILEFRISGNYEVLGQPSLEDQYVPADLPRWRNPVRLIDCGAYHGEMVKALGRNHYTVESAVMFEPDLANFGEMLAIAKKCANSFNFPCGVYSENKMLRFNSSRGESSCLSESGESFVLCVRLDDAIPDFSPTLIKMDIEGAELAALEGARQVIRKYQPDMAISLYHAPEHLWEIPLLIDDMDFDYKFYIRCHAHNSFDSVLYALHH